ncbi:MAG: AtzE family amidohydrolase [Azospirillaceae bacterium]
MSRARPSRRAGAATDPRHRVARALDAAEAAAPLGIFTEILRERAEARARAVDPAAPLAGLPFAAKNLFDVAGVVTLAGSRINRDDPPADADAALVERLEAAGAVLVGLTNMDEYAYGYTTENSHYGATHNPWDPTRTAGGSSGGSAAAVAAGIVPVALGTDTNGSIRVPAALSGVFGLKATRGRLSRRGVFPFVPSLDHAGLFARSVDDLAAAYDACLGPDPADPACAARPPEPLGGAGVALPPPDRIAVAGGFYDSLLTDEVRGAVARVAEALGAAGRIEPPDPERARAAGFLITTIEAAGVHRERLRRRADDFDPLIRDRLLAGALMPAGWYLQAQRLRRHQAAWWRQALARHDLVLAPATPCAAPPLGAEEMIVAGTRLPVRTGLGLFVQPLTIVGMPILTVPVHGLGPLPHGVQLVAPPWREDLLVAAARRLEAAGVATAPIAPAPPAGEDRP